MFRFSGRVGLALALVAGVFVFAPLRAAPPARIVAIGDVHGAADALTGILQRAGLIDAERRWNGGAAVLVQTGDLMDRGQGVRAALDLLMALEPQAAAAGGRVQVLVGNHEVMNMMGETRDATADIFLTFADARSESKREQAFEAARKMTRDGRLDKTEWLAAHPPGYVEYREAFKPNGKYGRWLRTKPILTEIDGTVFLHGGLSPDFPADSLDAAVRRARRELGEWDEGVRLLEQQKFVLPFATPPEVVQAAQAELAWLSTNRGDRPLSEEGARAVPLLTPLVNIDSASVTHPDGPLWFRGYSTWTDAEGAPLMAALIQKYRVKRFVTAHTPQTSGRITPRFGGLLYLIDTGMLNGTFYPGGRASALEITGDVVTPIY